MKLKETFGNVYHPVLHSIRNSPILHCFSILKCIKKSIKNENRKNRLYVDITNLHSKDNGTGIDRVTKEISVRLTKYTKKYDVICIYSVNFDGFYDSCTNTFVTFSSGDVYFSLDDATTYSAKYERLYKTLIKEKVQVFFFIHDLIPIRYPELCQKKSISRKFKSFLKRIVLSSGIICNSKSTYQDLCSWLTENSYLKHNKKLILGHSLLGCDFSVKKNNYIKSNVAQNNNVIDFLMVATVEPRKNYQQVIKAFTILWQRHNDIRLTIVGRKGWNAEKTFKLIENNSEYGNKLIWYNTGISDEKLYALYENSTAVIMASIIEGFGLSVAEAAHFGKPLILHDIPVFREIAGDNAFYFGDISEYDLANRIEEWIILYKNRKQPDSSKIELRTWDDCARDIYTFITGDPA